MFELELLDPSKHSALEKACTQVRNWFDHNRLGSSQYSWYGHTTHTYKTTQFHEQWCEFVPNILCSACHMRRPRYIPARVTSGSPYMALGHSMYGERTAHARHSTRFVWLEDVANSCGILAMLRRLNMSGAVTPNGSVLNHELIFGGGSPRGEWGSGGPSTRQFSAGPTLSQLLECSSCFYSRLFSSSVCADRRRLSFGTKFHWRSVSFTTWTALSGTATTFRSQHLKVVPGLHHVLCLQTEFLSVLCTCLHTENGETPRGGEGTEFSALARGLFLDLGLWFVTPTFSDTFFPSENPVFIVQGLLAGTWSVQGCGWLTISWKADTLRADSRLLVPLQVFLSSRWNDFEVETSSSQRDGESRRVVQSREGSEWMETVAWKLKPTFPGDQSSSSLVLFQYCWWLGFGCAREEWEWLPFVLGLV